MHPSSSHPSFRELLKGDLSSHLEKDSFSWWQVLACLRHPAFFSVFLFRASSEFYTKGKAGRFISNIFVNLNYLFHSCNVDPRAIIGPGLKLVHPMGVVLGPICAGNNLMVLQNVTIGPREASANIPTESCPVLGNDVCFSAGSVAVGPIVLGDDIVIGANTVVTEDIPSHSTAVGIPARIISKQAENLSS